VTLPVLLAAVLLLAGCGLSPARAPDETAARAAPAFVPVAVTEPLDVAPPPRTVPPAAEPATVIAQAYRELTTRLFREVRTPDLLAAGWRGVRDDARRQGFTDVEALRPHSESGTGDIDAFLREFNLFLAGPGIGLDPGRLAQGAIRAMTSHVGDSHTRYLSPQQSEARAGDSGYTGIGVVTRQDGGPWPVIGEVYAGSPAEQAGLRAGDRIVRVNGADIAGRQQAEISSQIRGAEGTSVDLTVLDTRGEYREVTVNRARISVPVVTARMEDGDIGYLRVAQFPRRNASVDAAGDFEAALLRLQADGARAFILDLRGNPGGDPTTSVDIASNFVPEGPIFVTVDRNNRRVVYTANKSRVKVNAPVVVLIDGGSASGAEVVASALAEHGVAHLIGSRTCGCLSVGQPLRLDDKSEIVVTVQQALTAKLERSLEGIGLDPDEVVRPARTGGPDAALERAVEYARSRLP
jgi:carboxyl-terminal processing protease